MVASCEIINGESSHLLRVFLDVFMSLLGEIASWFVDTILIAVNLPCFRQSVGQLLAGISLLDVAVGS